MRTVAESGTAGTTGTDVVAVDPVVAFGAYRLEVLGTYGGDTLVAE